MSEIQVTGAPAIDFDETAGIISGLILNGQGTGTAFASHHGRTMDALIVEQMIAANYAVAIDLHADIEDGSVAPIVFRSPDLLSSVALSADHYSARIEGGSIIGEVAASGDIQVNLVDVVAEQTSAFDDAVIIMWTTFNFDAQVNSMPIAVPVSYTHLTLPTKA